MSMAECNGFFLLRLCVCVYVRVCGYVFVCARACMCVYVEREQPCTLSIIIIVFQIVYFIIITHGECC